MNKEKNKIEKKKKNKTSTDKLIKLNIAIELFISHYDNLSPMIR